MNQLDVCDNNYLLNSAEQCVCPYFLLENDCVLPFECGSGKFLDTLNMKCDDCEFGCKNCLN